MAERVLHSRRYLPIRMFIFRRFRHWETSEVGRTAEGSQQSTVEYVRKHRLIVMFISNIRAVRVDEEQSVGRNEYTRCKYAANCLHNRRMSKITFFGLMLVGTNNNKRT